MNNERLHYLLGQWMERVITPEEENELTGYLEQHQDDGAVPELLQHFIENTVRVEMLSMEDRKRMLTAILQVDKTIRNSNTDRDIIRPINPNHPLRVTFRRWGWVAAAVLLLLAEVTVVLVFTAGRKNEQHTAVRDFAPGGSKVILTLGTAVALDSAGNRLIYQGTATLKGK